MYIFRDRRILYMLGSACVVLLLMGFLRRAPTVEVPSSSRRETRTPEARLTWPSIGCSNPAPEHWYGQHREDHVLYEMLYRKGVCKGTFVELGAFEGRFMSITRAYEDALQWTGLLIEALPKNAAKLKINRPNVDTVHSATCFENQTTVKFTQLEGYAMVGGVADAMTEEHKRAWAINSSKVVEVPCAPLGKLLQRASLAAVDMFILDVESGEYEVLRTMDWRVPVGVWVIELDGRNPVKDGRVRALLKQHTYVEVNVPQAAQNAYFLHPHYKAHLETL